MKIIVRKAAQLETKSKREITIKEEAADVYKKFVAAGKPDSLFARDSKAVLKYILPLLAPEEKIYEYNTGQKAMAQLSKFATESDITITWMTEMEKHVQMEEEFKRGLHKFIINMLLQMGG